MKLETILSHPATYTLRCVILLGCAFTHLSFLMSWDSALRILVAMIFVNWAMEKRG